MRMAGSIDIRNIVESDKEWIRQVMVAAWGSETVIASKPFNTLTLPGFIAQVDGKPAGVLTFAIAKKKCEIVSLNSTVQENGVGTALIDKVKEVAREKSCASVWLVTSNDNIDALRFYQKRGFRITKVHKNAIDEARKLKPQIPLIGKNGIPMKDAIELEFYLRA